jgi:acyl carrier protein
MNSRFRDVIQSVLGVDGSRLTPDDSPRSIPQWESVTHLQLMLALETEFGVQFSPEEMAQLSTVGMIHDRLLALGMAND